MELMVRPTKRLRVSFISSYMIGNDTLAEQTAARVKRVSLVSIPLRDLNPGESNVYFVASSVDVTTPNITIESDHILDY